MRLFAKEARSILDSSSPRADSINQTASTSYLRKMNPIVVVVVVVVDYKLLLAFNWFINLFISREENIFK